MGLQRCPEGCFPLPGLSIRLPVPLRVLLPSGGETVTVRVEGEDEAVAGPAMEAFFKTNL